MNRSKWKACRGLLLGSQGQRVWPLLLNLIVSGFSVLSSLDHKGLCRKTRTPAMKIKEGKMPFCIPARFNCYSLTLKFNLNTHAIMLTGMSVQIKLFKGENSG